MGSVDWELYHKSAKKKTIKSIKGLELIRTVGFYVFS